MIAAMTVGSLIAGAQERLGRLAGRAAVSERMPAPARALAVRLGGSCRVDAAAARKRRGTG